MADKVKRPDRSFEVRILDGDEEGRFEGYASVFGVIDSYGTVFDQGAFKKTIKDRKGQVPLVWMHDTWEPIGLARISEDDKGLLVDGQLDLNVQRGREVYSGMKMGYITQMSHSFRAVKEKREEAADKSQIPHFQEVRLFEISPVTTNFAANEEALITGVRTEEPEEPRVVVSDGMRAQMERLEALLNEPPRGTRAGEPPRKPGDHLQSVHRQMERLETLMRGD